MALDPSRAARATFATLLPTALLGAAALTSLLEVPARGPVALVAWAVAMAAPVVVLPALGAALAARRAATRAGDADVAALEARLGPLVGRAGTVRVLGTTAAGYPLAGGERPAWFVDDLDPSLRLHVIGDAPAAGTPVRITAARGLRPGEVPAVARGVGVRVTPTGG